MVTCGSAGPRKAQKRWGVFALSGVRRAEKQFLPRFLLAGVAEGRKSNFCPDFCTAGVAEGRKSNFCPDFCTSGVAGGRKSNFCPDFCSRGLPEGAKRNFDPRFLLAEGTEGNYLLYLWLRQENNNQNGDEQLRDAQEIYADGD